MEELLNNSLGCGYPIALANATEKENPVILQQYYDILKSKVPHQKEHCKTLKIFSSVQFSSVAQSCQTLCDPMNWHARPPCGEGNGTPLQYSCLENPMDGGDWWAAVHGVAKSQTRLSDFTFTFHFHAL